MSVDYEQHEDKSESHHMMMHTQQSETVIETPVPKHLLKIYPWRSRISCTILLLLFVVGSSIVTLISYHIVQSNNAVITKEQNKTIVSSDWNEKKNTEINYDVSKEEIPQELMASNDEQLPQLRSYAEYQTPKSPERIGHMNIYIDKNARRRSSRHYQRFRFPVARYDRHRMPFYGSFMHFMPRVPIFADRRTKQTLIYSQTGGVYVIPPLINVYGQLFSVAELIASGYASLVSSGVPPTGSIDMIRFFKSQHLMGPSIPVINPRTGSFIGGIRTSIGSLSISTRYRIRDNIDTTFETEEEDDDEYNNDHYEHQSVPYNDYQRRSKTTESPEPNTRKCQPPTSDGEVPPWLTMSSESSDPNEPIKFFLVLKQDPTAVQKLETIFWKITDPDNNEYQRWLTRSKINAILTLDNKVLTAVKYWLREQSFTSVKLLGTDVFEIQTTVGHVSKCFSAQFHAYKNSKTRKTIHRTLNEICLAEEISQYIDFWFGLNDFLASNAKPINPSKRKIAFENNGTTMDASTTQIYPMIVPQFVLSYYKIPDVLKTGLSSDVSQGSLQFIDQFYREQDLRDYMNAVGIPFKPLKKNHILGIDDQSDPGIETMLDVEQMVGIDPLAETWYFNYDAKSLSGDNFLSNLVAVNQLDDLPQILSISYGGPEGSTCTFVTNCKEEVVNLNKRYISRTNIEIMKLTMRGISVLVASGDDGANDDGADCTNKVFYPDYPASSPFVTSVGATTLVNVKYQPLQNQPPACTDISPLLMCVSGGDEIAVSYYDPLFVPFTSGGGFSNFASQPYYQKDAVNDYFRDKQYYINKNSENYPPSSMYNRNGRAYPDVAAFGVNALIVVGGYYNLVGGTSMSSPLWAGIVSILNSHSIEITGKTLGFLNPLLYKMAKECPDCFNDITVGNNKCTSTVCTDQCKGFQAACGWDPVTGLGSPNVGNMLQYITNLLKKKMKKTK